MTQLKHSPFRAWIYLIPGEFAGRCGIVDYGFRLACVAAEGGAEVTVASLRPVSKEVIGQHQATLSLEARARLRHVCLSENREGGWENFAALLRKQPEAVVSVQLYPLMFRRGPWLSGELWALRRALGGRRPLVTVHELSEWMVRHAGFFRPGLRVVRAVELGIGLRSLRGLGYFCSNAAHARELSWFGQKVRVVPIFSNIIRVDQRENERTEDMRWVAVMFGQIEDHDSARRAALYYVGEAQQRGRVLRVVSVGEVGHKGKGWEALKQRIGAEYCEQLGVLPADEISRVLGKADIGLIPTPLRLWLKSSVCAAMREHGLRIAFPDAVEPADGPLPERYALTVHGRLVFKEAPPHRRAKASTPNEVQAELDAVARTGFGLPLNGS